MCVNLCKAPRRRSGEALASRHVLLKQVINPRPLSSSGSDDGSRALPAKSSLCLSLLLKLLYLQDKLQVPSHYGQSSPFQFQPPVISHPHAWSMEWLVVSCTVHTTSNLQAMARTLSSNLSSCLKKKKSLLSKEHPFKNPHKYYLEKARLWTSYLSKSLPYSLWWPSSVCKYF